MHQNEVRWVLTRCHFEIQYTFLTANAVAGSAAVAARCAGRCVLHVNGASRSICSEGEEQINEEMTVLNRKRTCVWDLKTVLYWFGSAFEGVHYPYQQRRAAACCRWSSPSCNAGGWCPRLICTSAQRLCLPAWGLRCSTWAWMASLRREKELRKMIERGEK